jgi:hypothetical protein
MTLRYSLITSSNPNRLTKRFDLDDAGGLRKSDAGNMTAGHVRHASARDLRELAQQLDALAPNQAVAWGVGNDVNPRVCDGEDARIELDAKAR